MLEDYKMKTDWNAISVASELSRHGFRLSNPSLFKDGVRVGQPFSPYSPSAIMVSDGSKESTSFNNVIAFVYDHAPEASYFYLALDTQKVSPEQMSALDTMGAVFWKYKDHGAYGFIPFVSVGSKEPNLISSLEKLNELKLPTVPYPANENSLGIMPVFGDLGVKKTSLQLVAKELLNNFGDFAKKMDVSPQLSAVVDGMTGVNQPPQSSSYRPQQRRAAG